MTDITPLLIYAFWNSPDESFHTTDTVCAVTGMSQKTLANKRCTGGGIKFSKNGNMIYYKKVDVVAWFNAAEALSSTSAHSVRVSPLLVSMPQVG